MTTRVRTNTHTFVFAAVALAAGLAASGQQSKPDSQKSKTEAQEARWIDRSLPKDDRAFLEELVGYAPPQFTSKLTWSLVGAGKKVESWTDFAGQVVVVQSWTSAVATSRSLPQRVDQALQKLPANQLKVIALHTPDGANNADEFITKKPLPQNVIGIIDSTGEFCDQLGLFKHPANIIIDKQGEVRYVGIAIKNVPDAVEALLAEPYDAKKEVKQRAQSTDEVASSKPAVDFPPLIGKVEYATDLRGKRGPEFFVSKWLNAPQGEAPSAQGKVVVLEFWATDCPACVAAVPHMNQLAQQVGERVVMVAVTREKQSDFEVGMEKRNLKLSQFKYSIALDPTSKMLKEAQITAIPHCMVLSSDWVVRWQGNPAALKAKTIEDILAADTAMRAAGTSNSSDDAKKRWARTLQ